MPRSHSILMKRVTLIIHHYLQILSQNITSNYRQVRLPNQRKRFVLPSIVEVSMTKIALRIVSI